MAWYQKIKKNEPSRHHNAINIWVIIGYLASVFGGLVGMFIGSVLVSAKKALPGGEIAYVFNERSRKHGKIILYLSSVVLILSILFFINWFLLEKILFGKR
jgi:uncharacterized membrane-anchored protein YitT (DUF2179 family)